MTSMGALDGIKVLDLTIIVQGPQAGVLLADLGADVVKVELPGVGDLARWIPAAPGEPRSGYFQLCNRGKRGMTLDLRTPGGKRALEGLVRDADVILSNFKPGTMEDWGLGYEQLAAINPRLVYGTGSAFGPIGPDAEREGADLAGQAVGGLISATGVDGGDPTPVAAVIADHAGAQNLVIGVLTALFHRERTGVGQRVDVSLYGGQIWAQASEITAFLLSGRQPGRPNLGHPLIASIYRLFRTSDGWIAIVGVPAANWPGFTRAIDRPDLTEDPRYAKLFIDPTDLAELLREVETIFLGRTSAEWADRLRAEGQRWAPVHDYASIIADPQAWENGYLVRADHPEWGEITMVGSPIRFSATPAEPGVVAPELGSHTEEVLLEAGFDWDAIEALRADGAF